MAEPRCSSCQGTGRVKKEEIIEVNIPAGIENGQTLRINEEGEIGPYGGPKGNLLVNIHIQNHPDFIRQSENLLYELKLTFPQAVLGDKLEIPTLEVPVKLKIPAGIQPGEKIRLRGKGMPKLYGRGHGDLIIQVQVEIPKKISRKQKKLIEELNL